MCFCSLISYNSRDNLPVVETMISSPCKLAMMLDRDCSRDKFKLDKLGFEV